MRARLTHTLSYRYSGPVLLGPHRFCLKPRGHGFQRLVNFRLTLSPEPASLFPLMAASGDEIVKARFEGSTDHFTIQAVSEVVTEQAPDLAVALEANEPKLPYPVGQLNGDLVGSLAGWLPGGQHDPAAVDLAQDALMGSDQQALMFLDRKPGLGDDERLARGGLIHQPGEVRLCFVDVDGAHGCPRT
jgi:hypothetical protein